MSGQSRILTAGFDQDVFKAVHGVFPAENKSTSAELTVRGENMSVMFKILKKKFFGWLRGLLDSFEKKEADAPRPAIAAVTTVHIPPAAAAPPQPAAAPTPPPASTGGLELPLQPIVEKLPVELRARMSGTHPDLSRASIFVSVEKILPQLALGSVKITFGELRRAAPGLFSGGEEYDSLALPLPLPEVLARLNPRSLSRNPAQKAVVVPPEIAGPFAARPQEAAPIPAAPAMTQLPRAAVPVVPLSFERLPAAQQPPSFVTRQDDPPPVVPVATPVAPVATPAPMPDPAIISALLAALSENWPEALRLEIARLNLANAQVALPVNPVGSALKLGRVKFSWRDLRSWIRPLPPGESAYDAIELELPLKVIAPLFLSRQAGAARPQQKTFVAAEIPNLFFGFPQPEPAAVEVAPRPVPATASETASSGTNYFEKPGAARVSDTEFRQQPVATNFLSRYATPDEIVTRAAALNGVAGTLVALPDGLMVASRIPPELNPDTLAAFLPQLFNRVSQSSNELRMGELNNLNFTVGAVSWKIFRVNAVYFAAFSRAGETLPTAELAALAAQLDRKKQQ